MIPRKSGNQTSRYCLTLSACLECSSDFRGLLGYGKYKRECRGRHSFKWGRLWRPERRVFHFTYISLLDSGWALLVIWKRNDKILLKKWKGQIRPQPDCCWVLKKMVFITGQNPARNPAGLWRVTVGQRLWPAVSFITYPIFGPKYLHFLLSSAELHKREKLSIFPSFNLHQILRFHRWFWKIFHTRVYYGGLKLLMDWFWKGSSKLKAFLNLR